MNGFVFNGKKIIVAGCGGIGTAIIRNLLLSNAKVIAIDVSELNLLELRKRHEGNRLVTYTCDFSDVTMVEPLMKQIVADNGSIDGLVYAAGVGLVRPLRMSKYAFMKSVMDINFFSFVEMVRAVSGRGMFNSEGMNIVGISAVGAFLGNSAKTAYCASKGAMNAAVRCLAKELAPLNIRVNTVAPGATDTPMMREAEATYGDGSDTFKEITNRQYLGVCSPDDISNAVVFLLSEMSRKITGTCLAVDAGKLTS